MSNLNEGIDFKNRQIKREVDDLFVKRWSPRSFKKVDISNDEIESIFEAARWAPSSYNAQPWRFIISSSEQEFEKFFDFILESNQVWAKNASRIGFILSQNKFEHNQQQNQWAEFDAGSAWMSFTLQANLMGYHTHGLAGIKYEDVYRDLNIPKEKFKLICGFVIGKKDSPDFLPDHLKERETPSSRKPLSEILNTGKFNF